MDRICLEGFLLKLRFVLEGSFIRGERLRKIRGLRIYFVDRDKILRLAPLVRHSFGYFPAAVGRKVTLFLRISLLINQELKMVRFLKLLK